MTDRDHGEAGDGPEAPVEDAMGGRDHARIDATVVGRVQGVGFRWFVVEEARDLGLTGWVANEPDGSVRCVAEGPRRNVEALVAALERGPLGARVDRVVPRWGRSAGGMTSFEVRTGYHRGD